MKTSRTTIHHPSYSCQPSNDGYTSQDDTLGPPSPRKYYPPQEERRRILRSRDTLYSAEMSDEFPVRWTAHSIMDDLVELCGGGTLQVYGVC